MNKAANDLIRTGWEHHQRGDFDAAGVCYRRAIEYDTKHFDCWHLLGLTLIQKGKPAEAVIPLGNAVELNPTNPDARIHLGTALAQNGEPEKAIVHFQAAQLLNPKLPVAHLNCGLALANLGILDEAKSCFTQLLSLESNNPVALLNLGRIESELGNSGKAIEIFQQLERAYPKEKIIALMHAAALHKAGEYKSALIKIDSCINLNPRSDDAINSKGLILRSMGRQDEALACFKAAVDLSPNNPIYLGQLGALQNELGDFKNSEKHLRRACEISPRNSDTLINLGYSLTKQSKNQEALEFYRKALINAPASFDTLHKVGASLLKLGALHEAEHVLSTALKMNANSTSVICNMAKCFNKTNRHHEAIDLCLRAIDIEPTNAEIYLEIASGYEAIGMPIKVFEYLKLGVRNAGNNPALLNSLGKTESDFGAYVDAIEHLRNAEIADPDYPDPKFNKSLIEITQFDLKAGWKNFEFRWSMHNFDSERIEFPCPQWAGEKCNNLVIWKEQGIGDQILFCTLLLTVKKIVPNITVIIDPRLITMMSATHPGIKFVGSKSALPIIRFDFHIPMGSLPSLFCKSLEEIAAKPFPFISAPAAKKEEVRSLLGANTRTRIGIAWRSSNNSNSQSKSIDLELLLKAIEQDKHELLCLQYGDVSSEISRALDINPYLHLRSFPQLDLYKDVDALAALIENCDLVLTSSNATAHFAGAIGKPAVVLTPFAKGKHWYWWHTNNQQSAWYPTVHVLSQGKDLNWETPLLQSKGILSRLQKGQFAV